MMVRAPIPIAPPEVWLMCFGHMNSVKAFLMDTGSVYCIKQKSVSPGLLQIHCAPAPPADLPSGEALLLVTAVFTAGLGGVVAS